MTDETWIFSNDKWRQLHPEQTPGLRGSATLGYDPDRHQTVLYGGFDETGNELADTWLWDGDTWSCAANCP